METWQGTGLGSAGTPKWIAKIRQALAGKKQYQKLSRDERSRWIRTRAWQLSEISWPTMAEIESHLCDWSGDILETSSNLEDGSIDYAARWADIDRDRIERLTQVIKSGLMPEVPLDQVERVLESRKAKKRLEKRKQKLAQKRMKYALEQEGKLVGLLDRAEKAAIAGHQALDAFINELEIWEVEVLKKDFGFFQNRLRRHGYNVEQKP